MSFIDPPPAPEPGEGSIRAKDLRNRVVVLRATGTGLDEAVLDKNGKPWTWVTCDVWVIDRAGIELAESGLRVSWWRVQDQLKQAGESFVAGRVSEQEDKSVILTPVTGTAREVLEQVMPEILASAKPQIVPTTEDQNWDNEEPI